MRPEDLSLPFLVLTGLVVVRVALGLRGLRWAAAREWWLALALVVVGASITAALAPALAGLVALGLAAALVLAPGQLQLAAGRAFRRGDERRAVGLARLAALLHPSALFRDRPRLYAFLLALRLDEASASELEHFGRDPEIGEILPSLVAHVRGDIPGLIARMGDPEARQALLRRGLGLPFLRAVGVSVGDGDALVRAFEEIRALDPALHTADTGAVVVVMLTALAGDVDRTRSHAEALRTYLAPGEAEAALALALARSGDLEAAEAHLGAAAIAADRRRDRMALALFAVYRRILREHLVARAGPPSPTLSALLDRLAADVPALQSLAATEGRAAERLPLTWGLAGVLAAMYAFTGITGDPLDPEHLYACGGLATTLEDPEWRVRIFSATLLHAGILHLIFNLIGLRFFGRFVEPLFGVARTLVVYLAAGALSSLGVLLLADASAPQLLVGASGAILGLGGAALAGLLARPTLRRSTRGRAQIRGLLVIFGLQMILDQLAPAVSGTAHLAGLVVGFVVGFVVVPRGGPR